MINRYFVMGILFWGGGTNLYPAYGKKKIPIT